MDESVSMDEFKMSPATDALDFLLNAATQANTSGLEVTTLSQQDDQVSKPSSFSSFVDCCRRSLGKVKPLR
jgi:hypothetical protein